VRHDEGPVVRTGPAPDPARGGRRCVRQHHALAAHAHIAAALRRFHRVPGQGARHIHVGARRARAVRSVARQHEVGVQGQEEAHVPRQRAVRVTRARRGDDALPQMMSSLPCSHDRARFVVVWTAGCYRGRLGGYVVVDCGAVSLLLLLFCYCCFCRILIMI